MALLGLTTAFVVSLLVYGYGDGRTRQFARTGFWGLALIEMGLTLDGITHATDLVIRILPVV
ncbi:hypothetical protein [Halomarina oriensis]|uniref:Uncharacterized protein n=1 Tax=Halomarina oriensis TaxID=671145 RepID=A0A6B0GYW5_9EURY|nr:hypothetical protein [Halomarina oriensis]MWG36948.1 hypothetical protein [Halomarina oriensis]